jgi:hypothetical protein
MKPKGLKKLPAENRPSESQHVNLVSFIEIQARTARAENLIIVVSLRILRTDDVQSMTRQKKNGVKPGSTSTTGGKTANMKKVKKHKCESALATVGGATAMRALANKERARQMKRKRVNSRI